MCSIHDEDELDDYHIINPVLGKTTESRKERISTVRLLLEAGADVNAKGQLHGIQGLTLLHQTARMGNLVNEIFDLLLERGADVDSEDEDGQTPLFQAVLADDVYYAQGLIEKGARVNHTDKASCTALHISTGNLTLACKPIITSLPNYGADISALTQQRETSLHLALHHGNSAAVRISSGLNFFLRHLTSFILRLNLSHLFPPAFYSLVLLRLTVGYSRLRSFYHSRMQL